MVRKRYTIGINANIILMIRKGQIYLDPTIFMIKISMLDHFYTYSLICICVAFGNAGYQGGDVNFYLKCTNFTNTGFKYQI